MSYGIRKVNEFIVKTGRALVLNNQEATGELQWNSIADGTLFVNPGLTGNFLKYKKSGSPANEWTYFKPIDIFETSSIVGSLIDNGTITQTKMAPNSIGTNQLIDKNITSIKIADGAIKQAHFTDFSLNGNMFIDKSIPICKINGNFDIGSLTGNISGSSITDGTIPNGKLAANSVGTITIIDGSITNPKLSTNSTNTINIINEAVTYEKLAKPCVKGDNINATAVDTNHLVDKCVTNQKIADTSISTSKIIGGLVGGVRTEGAVTNDKIATNAVDTRVIVNGAVTKDKLEANLKASIESIIANSQTGSSATKGDFEVKGNLTVAGNITASPADKTKYIQGFKVYNPVFADYAEGFEAEKNESLEEGDIVEINRYGLIRRAAASSRKVIGVISNQYGLCLGASRDEIEEGKKIAVGLVGKVPINILGKVEVGDLIISAGEGIGAASINPKPYTVIGIALEDKTDNAIGKVLCLIK